MSKVKNSYKVKQSNINKLKAAKVELKKEVKCQIQK